MLAKQAWRVLTRPDSLVAKILKSKYFPHSPFLTAKISPIASYTWKSICSVRSLIMKGARKLVGDGASIDIWQDPWVSKLPNFHVLSPRNSDENGINVVRDLIEEGKWNTTLLHSLFSNWEVSAILQEFIPEFPTQDEWTWTCTKNGVFSVRSAYYLALRERDKEGTSTSAGHGHTLWQKLWLSCVPPKMRLFGWKLLHGGVPVRSQLASRGMQLDEYCPICGEDKETIQHAFCLCPEARFVWQVSALRLQVDELVAVSLWDWLEKLVKIYTSKEWWSEFWSLVWQVWLRRNKWCFNSHLAPFDLVVAKASGAVGEYEKANASSGSVLRGGVVGITTWTCPPTGKYKANSDAAVFSDGVIGLGGVVRDAEGDVMLAVTEPVSMAVEVDVAEALALRLLVRVAGEAGLRALILEVDSLKLYTALRQRCKEASPFGVLVRDILSYANLCSFISFSSFCVFSGKKLGIGFPSVEGISNLLFCVLPVFLIGPKAQA